jgi:uncharacterized membrane protein YgcG
MTNPYAPQPNQFPARPQRSLWRIKRLYAIGFGLLVLGSACGTAGAAGGTGSAAEAKPAPTVTRTVTAMPKPGPTVTKQVPGPTVTVTKQVPGPTVTVTKTVASDDDSSGGSGSDDGSGGGGGSAYYSNCDAARAAGAAPVHAGDPGYGRHLDRDGDGVGCES